MTPGQDRLEILVAETCVVCRRRPRRGYSATCSADCLDLGLRGAEGLPAPEPRRLAAPAPIVGTCARCGLPLVGSTWHADSGECIATLRQQLADAHTARRTLQAEKDRAELDELESQRAALRATKVACEFGEFFASVMADAQATARLADAALHEVARLRSVILTGGAMYRAERSMLGVPGGIDEDQRGPAMIDDVTRSAALSPCGRYRYRLRREWPATRETGHLTFVMLNPSTADGAVDDATVRKCVGFARRYNDVNAIEVVNLFAWRSTDPQGLWHVETDVVGPDNNVAILTSIVDARLVVVAWGAHPTAHLRDRDVKVLDMIRAAGVTPFCLGTTKDGNPRHPLMVAYATALEPYASTEGGTKR